MPVAGVPASISFEIVGGTAQDGIHAMYKKGSSVRLRAIIRDGYGNIITPTADHPCTPEFSLEDTGTPSGGSRATRSGDIINFIDDGSFTVSVACREHPEINSHSNTAPYNFETNDTSPFTHEAHVPNAAPAARGMSLGTVLLVVAASAGLAYLLIDEVAPTGGGDCGCRCAYGGDDCDNGGTAFCTNLYGFPVGCAATKPADNCNCANGATARVAPPRTVDELVARGLRDRPARTARAAHVDPDLRAAHPHATGTTTPSSSHLGAWIGGTVVAASLVTTAYMLWTHAHPHRIDVAPYVGPDGGGFSVLGRF